MFREEYHSIPECLLMNYKSIVHTQFAALVNPLINPEFLFLLKPELAWAMY